MIVVLAFGAVWAVAAAPETQVAVVPAVATKADAAKLRTQALQNALAGQFAEGLQQFQQAAKAAPSDPIVVEAVRLLERYTAQSGKASRQRAREYEDTVPRVRHSQIAQVYAEKADKEHLKKLRADEGPGGRV